MQIQIQNSTAITVKVEQLPWKGKVKQIGDDAEKHVMAGEPDVYSFDVECDANSPEEGRQYKVLAEIIDDKLDVAEYWRTRCQ